MCIHSDGFHFSCAYYLPLICVASARYFTHYVVEYWTAFDVSCDTCMHPISRRVPSSLPRLFLPMLYNSHLMWQILVTMVGLVRHNGRAGMVGWGVLALIAFPLLSPLLASKLGENEVMEKGEGDWNPVTCFLFHLSV